MPGFVNLDWLSWRKSGTFYRFMAFHEAVIKLLAGPAISDNTIVKSLHARKRIQGRSGYFLSGTFCLVPVPVVPGVIPEQSAGGYESGGKG